MKIITFGTYDLFHIGHLNIINRCKNYNITINSNTNIMDNDESSNIFKYIFENIFNI